MEITRKNFKENLPLIEESIKKADFLVIDTEFTGLINGRDVSMFDSPQVYYSTLLNGAADFLLIQYGLCAFYWNEEKQHYMHDAYNFYLFPRGRPGPEKVFLCQSSSLDFLAAQGFDFNKLIREGISYMTEPTETRLRENLLERQKSFSTASDTILIPDENKQQIEDICKRVRQFLDEKKLDEMEIDRCNAFIRRLLFQELRTRFGSEAFFETKILENKNRVLKVTRVTSATDGKDRDAQKRERELDDFEEAVGFSKVARMISQSEKLIIGHNMLLDILHTLNHFFQPLPTDYVAFKEFAHCMFPRLLDTKYMSSLPPFKDKVNSSVLQHLLATLSEPPFSLPVTESIKGRGYQRTADKLHEAGYDAYVTGLCFLSMHSHLSRMRGEPGDARVSPVHSAALKPFVNKLFLSKTAHQDSPYMNLTGDDPTPARDHVFHLTFPKEWQRSDLNNVFSPFGAVTIQFLDDTSALVALTRRERAQAAVRALRRHQRVAVVKFADFVSGNAHGHGKLRHKNQETLHPAQTITQAFIPDTNTSLRQGLSTQPARAAVTRRPPLPERVERPRSHSVSAPVHAPPARKRTSSGVFQVDEAEPPTKKGEPLEESMKKIEMITNGRRKDKEKLKEKPKQKEIKEPEPVQEKFDSAAESMCVSAFKESDTWD